MNSGWWIADLLESGQHALLISWIVWVIGAICLHELAHGWAAIRLGDDTPIVTGHMTWNPLVHMGPWSLLMFAVVGLAWGLMPVSPHKLRGRHGEAIVAFAGPAMNIGLAFGSMVLGGLWVTYGSGVGEPLYTNLLSFFWIGVQLNIILAVFNLLPAPPLDGSRILAHYNRKYRELLMSPRAQMVSLVLLIVVFFNAGDFLFGPASDVATSGMAFISTILP